MDKRKQRRRTKNDALKKANVGDSMVCDFDTKMDKLLTSMEMQGVRL